MKKRVVDSSVWVALRIARHPDHARAMAWYTDAKAQRLTLYTSAHALGETFRAMVSYYKVPRKDATALLRSIAADAQVLSLDARHYLAAARMITPAMSASLIYDALHACQAKALRGDVPIITFNIRDFVRVYPKDLVMAP